MSLENYPQILDREEAEWKKEIHALIDSYENGKKMTEGIMTVIVGKPNAGKSSLLNLLIGEDRAIVTEVAGTTRDILQEQISIHGISLNVIDTAGIRKTEDVVEKIGVGKARSYAREADLIIYVVDSSTELDENDKEIAKLLEGKRSIVLLNKSDLEAVTREKEIRKIVGENPVILPVSAKEQKGIDTLENAIRDLFFTGKLSYNDQIYITNMRQKAALLEAAESLDQVRESLEKNMPEDFYSIDLMSAYEALGRIIGESVEEDLVNEIFSKFCMGK